MKSQKFRNYFISDSFDKALAIDPKNVHALTNKGLALGLGKYNESLIYYKL
jgi:hypothetical protein